MPHAQIDSPQPVQQKTGKPAATLSTDVVIRRVLERLGRPRNLYRVDAKELWPGKFRVNIYCSVESHAPVQTVEMTESFFVTATEAGIVSDPPILRKYAGLSERSR